MVCHAKLTSPANSSGRSIDRRSTTCCLTCCGSLANVPGSGTCSATRLTHSSCDRARIARVGAMNKRKQCNHITPQHTCRAGSMRGAAVAIVRQNPQRRLRLTSLCQRGAGSKSTQMNTVLLPCVCVVDTARSPRLRRRVNMFQICCLRGWRAAGCGGKLASAWSLF